MDLSKLAMKLASQKKAYENRKTKLRENYRYARDKGFSASESQVLSFYRKVDIDYAAWQRDGAKDE